MIFAERFRRVQNQIDSLSLRERALIMLGAFMVLFLLWDWLLMGDINRRSKELANGNQAIQERMRRLSESIATTVQTRGVDPNVAMQKELTETRDRISALDETLGARSGSVIPPRAMAGLIEQVLQRQGKLKLISATSIPPRALFETAEGDNENATNTVYRHGLELEIEGRYLDVLDYLRELESLEWQFFWETVALESDDYPNNRVKIRVYSLNLEEGWLGV